MYTITSMDQQRCNPNWNYLTGGYRSHQKKDAFDCGYVLAMLLGFRPYKRESKRFCSIQWWFANADTVEPAQDSSLMNKVLWLIIRYC